MMLSCVHGSIHTLPSTSKLGPLSQRSPVKLMLSPPTHLYKPETDMPLTPAIRFNITFFFFFFVFSEVCHHFSITLEQTIMMTLYLNSAITI